MICPSANLQLDAPSSPGGRTRLVGEGRHDASESDRLLLRMLYGHTVPSMDRESSKLHDLAWVAQCAHRLRQRWPHADPTSIEEAAIELWADGALRAMPGERAAERWLQRGAQSGGTET